MGIHYKQITKLCPCCKGNLTEVWIKNTEIDDYHYACLNWDCSLAGVKQ